VTAPRDFDRLLTAWFVADAPVRARSGLADEAIAQIGRTGRRGAWRLPERWLSVQATLRLAPGRRPAILLAALFVLLALVAGLIVVGSRPHVPAPFGVAKPGMIVFSDGQQVRVSNVDGSHETLLTLPGDIETNPIWSRDGTRLAMWAQAARSGAASLIVEQPDGSGRQVLVTGVPARSDAFVAFGPVWAPDGSSILYAIIKPDPALFSIYVVSSRGGPPTELVADAPAANLAWSPDSRTIAFQGGSTATGDRGVWVVPADGSAAPRRLSHAAGLDGAFADIAWSPDGRHLTYRAGQPDGFTIYEIDADGTNERELSAPTASAVCASWSPSGDRILYGAKVAGSDTDGSGQYQLEVVAPDGSGARIVKAPAPISFCDWSWSPDGLTIMAGTIATGVYLLDPAGAKPPVAIPNEGDWQRLG